MVYHQKEGVVVAEGNVTFSDGQVKTISDKATNKLNSDLVTLENTQYNFLCEPGRGEAVYVSKTGKAVYEIEDGTITSCPEGDNSWRMRASSIDIDQNEEEATFYNPRFEIANVPVFYLPFLTVPIGDTRKTGFLYPTVSYGSKNGLETEIPIYWNLAPDYDLKTTFKNMQKRGNRLDSEFRYLSDFGFSTIKTEYLDEDKKFPEYNHRWVLQWQHTGIFQENWKFETDYSKVSDTRYFTDVDSSIGKQEDGQLIQEFKAAYRSTNWNAEILSRDFQVLTDSNSNLPYRVLPQLSFNYYSPQVMKSLDFDLLSHVSRFGTDAEGKPSATRLHIEPGLTVPIGNTWGSWTTEVRLLTTYYQQDLKGVDTKTPGQPYYGIKEEVSRTIPEFRSLAGIILERDSIILDHYTQTIEPQIQYLYVPTRDQSRIANYDTTLLETDYYGLFRSRKYSGVDKIAGANQFSYGATTRFYDDQFKERLNLSFGQIIYLDKKTKTQSLLSQTNEEASNYSAWAIEMDFNYADYLFYHGGIQYDIDSSELQLGNSTLEYRFDDGYVQTNYRYVTRKYIESTLGESIQDLDVITEDGISQLGLLSGYRLTRKWSANAQYFYDLTTDRSIEWLGGLTYTSDCWYIGFTYSNKLVSWEPSFTSYPNAQPTYENNFGFNFGVIGFGTQIGTSTSEAGSVAGSGSSSGMSLGYGRPFLLNN
jgi:LPS-assembly protein